MQIWVCSKTRWLRFCQYGSIYCSLSLVENVARVLLQVSFHLASEPEMLLESVFQRHQPYLTPSLLFHNLYEQMNSVDAAIDRRISESRLAGRMAL